jgi:hypothetical protein
MQAIFLYEFKFSKAFGQVLQFSIFNEIFYLLLLVFDLKNKNYWSRSQSFYQKPTFKNLMTELHDH